MFCILLDLSTAFDGVCHKILIYTLQSFGIKGNVPPQFHGYLIENKQLTVMGLAMVVLVNGHLELFLPKPLGQIIG